jgi:hypothetical protein
MPFPNIKPASRAFSPGDFPIKTYKSQAGIETRILYGSRRTGGELTLSYENINHVTAAQFTTHYDETKGTYATFTLPGNTYAGTSSAYANPGAGNRWRYAEPPQITSVKSGLSTVQVKLVAAL